MTKQEILNKLNKKIDELIINGQKGTDKYKTLTRIHKQIRNEIEAK